MSYLQIETSHSSKKFLYIKHLYFTLIYTLISITPNLLIILTFVSKNNWIHQFSSAVRSTGLRHLSVMFNRLRFDASIRLKSNPLGCRLIQSPPDPFDVPGYLGKHQRSFLNPSLTRVLRSKDIPTGFWAYPRDLPAHQTLMVSNVYSAVPLSWHITPSPLPLPV